MLRLVSIMLSFNVTDEHLMLFARLKAGTSSNMRLESIVVHLQGSAHRVRSVCRVWERRCVIALQATIHFPLPLECPLYGYFWVCFAVEVRETFFGGRHQISRERFSNPTV